MAITQIQSADDLAALAAEAVQQARAHGQYRDLIAAILMANHVADWHFCKDLGHKKLTHLERNKMKAIYPEWDALRDLANGTKHCDLQAHIDANDWEDNDFWDSPSHAGKREVDWFTELDGCKRSVTVLIEKFLEKFADHSLRPS